MTQDNDREPETPWSDWIRDWIYDHYAYVTAAVAVILAVATATLSKEGYLERGLFDHIEVGLQWWLPFLVLAWLWKFDRHWRNDLRSSLLRKAKRSEKLVGELWDAFSETTTHGNVGNQVRTLLLKYPSVVDANDVRVEEKIKQKIDDALSLVQRREYPIDFDDMAVYPKPFYESAKSNIIATNIGNADQFWRQREDLVKMNAQARDGSSESPDQSTTIRRVFAFTPDDGIDELTKLMVELQCVGVEIKYIGLKRARKLAKDQARQGSDIAGLADFTVFDTATQDLKYSGRFDANHRRIVISSHPQMILDLQKQFQVLWDEAKLFDKEEGVDMEVVAR